MSRQPRPQRRSGANRRPAPTDRELMTRLRTDDVAALDLIMDRHWEPVLDYAVRSMECGESAQDLAQQAFVDLWEGRGGWDEGSLPRPVLLSMVRNRVLNEHRWEEVRSRFEPRVRRMANNRRAISPADEVVAREIEDAFRQALKDLSPRRREVFVLARFQHLTYSEISEVLGTSPQTVANQMSKALHQLRDALTRSGGPLEDFVD